MAEGFRWGRRPLVPRSAEPFAARAGRPTFPTAWARTEAGTAARQLILQSAHEARCCGTRSASRVHGLDTSRACAGPVMFVSNHTSHLDATLIMTSLPDAGRPRPRSAPRRDYFFDVWWRQAFTALVYGAFPIDRAAAAGEGRRARRAS